MLPCWITGISVSSRAGQHAYDVVPVLAVHNPGDLDRIRDHHAARKS